MYSVLITCNGVCKPVLSNGKETVAELFFKVFKSDISSYRKIKLGWSTVSAY